MSSVFSVLHCALYFPLGCDIPLRILIILITLSFFSLWERWIQWLLIFPLAEDWFSMCCYFPMRRSGNLEQLFKLILSQWIIDGTNIILELFNRLMRRSISSDCPEVYRAIRAIAFYAFKRSLWRWSWAKHWRLILFQNYRRYKIINH